MGGVSRVADTEHVNTGGAKFDDVCRWSSVDC